MSLNDGKRFWEVVDNFVNTDSFYEGTDLDGTLGRKIVDYIGDSLDMIEFVMELEEDFGICIEDGPVSAWETFGDAYETCLTYSEALGTSHG